MTGVNIGASEPALFPGDLTISYDTYLRWFEYISEMNCNCVRVYTTMRPQFYLALRDFNEKAEKPVYLYQGIWVNEDDIERLGDVYAENEKDSGEFDEMLMCYGYNLTVKGTDKVIPDKAYETGKLLYGNGNPDADDYASLTDFCYADGKVALRIPWQLLNVMDPSSKQQMSDFWQEQVFAPQDYDSFSFGMGVCTDKSKKSISFGGSYTYTGWNTPTWHERLKPSYFELQEYLRQYRESSKAEPTK